MKTKKEKFGFTLVELLTVMAIISLLIGILVPALNMVRRIAKDTRQKAQFHSIGVAMETYVGESGLEQYPDSTILPSTGGEPDAAPFTVGAQRLTEALIGRDFLGLDTWTTWNAYADETNPNIYARAGAPKNSLPAEVNDSLDRRKGPYLNPENVEAYQIGQLYTEANDVYDGYATGASSAPVLTDSYRVKTIALPNGKQVKAGTPILYYKANGTSKNFENSTSPGGSSGISDVVAAGCIFNSLDNEQLLSLGTIMDQSKEHRFNRNYGGTLKGRGNFYDAITNPKITTQVRPYNQASYILMSAGFDGIFGTPDDIYNFSE